MSVRWIPNVISSIRILLVFPVAWFLWHQDYRTALLLFVIAGLSDGLDGYLARRYRWTTSLGGWLDPVADKLMQVTTYVMLAVLSLIPSWLVMLVLARDILIVAGGFFYYYRVERINARPSVISKVNTVFQILLVVVVLFDRLHGFEPWLVQGMIWLVAVTTLWSGVDYVITWGMRAWQATQQITKRRSDD